MRVARRDEENFSSWRLPYAQNIQPNSKPGLALVIADVQTVPTFSVVIPTHERGPALAATVRSVLGQTTDDFELIVVDDASSVPASDVVGTLAQDARLRFVRLDENRGVAHARNRGISAARGEYVAFLDDDDRYRPEKLERVAAVIDRTHADVVYHQMAIHFVREGFSYLNLPHGEPFTLSELLVKNLLGSPSMVVARRDLVQRVGMFDASLPALEDYDLWIRLKEAGGTFAYLDEPLADYVRDTSRATRSLNLTNDVRAWEMLHEKYDAAYATFGRRAWRDHLQKIASYRGFRALLAYRRVEAARWFSQAAGTAPRSGAAPALLGAALASLVSPRQTLRLQARLKRARVFRGVFAPRREGRVPVDAEGDKSADAGATPDS